MRHFRALSRLVLIFLITGILYAFWIFGVILNFGSPRRRFALRRAIIQTWARMVTVVIGMRVKTIGSPPRPPFFLVANHLSYIDVLLFMTTVRGALISRADVRHWPLIGHLAVLSGTIFIDRARAKDVVRVNTLIKSALTEDQGVILFPEGTSTRGIDVGSFHSSLLAYPATAAMPVHFASISYRTIGNTPPADQTICWWGNMTFMDHFYNLLTIPRFETLIHFGEKSVTRLDRKELAETLRNSIRSNFVPIIQKISR